MLLIPFETNSNSAINYWSM